MSIWKLLAMHFASKLISLPAPKSVRILLYHQCIADMLEKSVALEIERVVGQQLLTRQPEVTLH